MKKVLVSGVTGFVGSRVSKFLLDRDYLVMGISRLNDTSKINEFKNHKNFKLVECDITSYDEICDVVKRTRPDIIIHTAALLFQNNYFDLSQYCKTNICGTSNLLQSACECNIKNLIYTSTMQVYGTSKYLPVDEVHLTEPLNEYGITKLAGEMLCRMYSNRCGIKITILRYSGIFGPKRKNGAIYNFIENALNGNPLLISSDGSDTWDAISIDDAIKAIISAIENKNQSKFEIFNIGYGKEMKLLEIANKIIELTNSDSKIIIEDKIKPINFYYNIFKAQKSLGFIPSPIEENINKFIRYIKSFENQKL